MSNSTTDDLDAVKAIVTALDPFEQPDQERILRWVREKLGLSVSSAAAQPPPAVPSPTPPPTTIPPTPEARSGNVTIRDFVASKRPSSDNQFAAVVAYYFRFEASESERKDTISSDDLQDACRTAGRQRLANPSKTLHNALSMGLLDKSGRGSYRINSVGENLVAMTLPDGEPTAQSPRKKARKPVGATNKIKAKKARKTAK